MVGACQIGSGAFGEWFWWLYMVVRLVSYCISSRSLTIQIRFRYTLYSNCGRPLSLRYFWEEQQRPAQMTSLRKNLQPVNDKKS